MEKFSSWRDKGTGIAPFIPSPEPKQSVPVKAVSLLALTVKFPFLLIAFVVSYVLPSPAVISFILKVLFTVNRFDYSVQGVKRSNVDQVNLSKPTVGDLVVVNYVLPIDSLILVVTSQISWKKAAFVVPHSGDLYGYSMWAFVSHAFQIPGSQPQGKIVDVRSLKNKVTFLFAEGTPSNNKALLPFEKIDWKQFSAFNWKVLSLKVSPVTLPLPIPTKTRSQYFFSLLRSMIPGAVKLRLVPASNLPNRDVLSVIKAFETNNWNFVGDSLHAQEKRHFFDSYIRVYRT